jgi:hypothetical protein
MLTSGSRLPVSPLQARLMSPPLGVASMPQAMAVKMGGM